MFMQPMPARMMCSTRARAALAGVLMVFTSCATPPVESTWTELFDGQTTQGWRHTEFGGEGEVIVENGAMQLAMGSPLTGVTLTAPPPSGNYELEVVAARIEGTDFFCGLTFPVGDNHLTLILGGW